MKLYATILLLFTVVLRASSQPPLTIEVKEPHVWMAPHDLSLGPGVSLRADQSYGSVITLRSEVRQLMADRAPSGIAYRWFVRNTLDRVVSIAVVRPLPPPLDPQLLPTAYGATWARVAREPLSTSSLYRVRTKDAVGWNAPPRHAGVQDGRIQWLILQPDQEKLIHSAFVPTAKPMEAAVFSIPFQVDELAGEAVLCSILQ